MAIPRNSDFSWLWQEFKRGGFTLCYTTSILNEYFEVLAQYYSSSLAKNVINAILDAPHAVPITVYFNWQLITSDPDDNKFVDCAISANANYIVTNDRHFNVLKTIEFPPIKVVDIETFKDIIVKYKLL
jgi:putative PIN family toxin of toxin-antitoxin system